MSLCSHFASLKAQKLANMIKKSTFKCTNPMHQDIQFNLCLHCGESKCNNVVNGNGKDNCFQLHMQNNNKHVLALQMKDCSIYCYRCNVDVQRAIQDLEEQGLGGDKIEKMRQLLDKIKQMAINNLPHIYQGLKNSKSTKTKDSQTKNKQKQVILKNQTKTQASNNTLQMPQLRVFGLSNIGNTCYFNSVLQCLFSLPEIHSLYTQLELRDDFNRTFHKFLLNSEKVFSPKNLFSALSQKFKFLKSMNQQDAYELYVLLIDSLIQSRFGKEQKVSFRDKVNNSIGKIFGFYCASRLECLQCGKISWNKDFNLGLTIPLSKPICKKIEIPEDSQIDSSQIGESGLRYPSLQTSNNFLDNFFSGELLTKSNSFKCEQCKESKAAKKFYIIQPPQILTINFKKFTNSGKKIDNHIAIPSQIELAAHCLKKGTFTYELHAGVVHSGSSGGGHYIAYSQRANNKWYYFSDSNVKAASYHSLKDNNPYILMYRRKIFELQDMEYCKKVETINHKQMDQIREQSTEQVRQEKKEII